MERFPGIRRVLRLGLAERELDDELAFHFERTVEELMSGGDSREQAEAEARRRFGDERYYRRELEKIDRGLEARLRWAGRWEVAVESVRYAVRRLARAPGFTLGVVLTFALGIGANATMFSILDRVLLSPPAHVEDAEQVKRLMVESYAEYRGSREIESYLTFPDYLDFTRASSFSEVAGYAPRTLTVGQGEEARQIAGTLATANLFPLLGVRPAYGRFFDEQEERFNGPSLVVISHELWRGRYGGDRGILGQTLDFGYGPYTIVGVAPEGFTGVDLVRSDLWLPLRSTQAAMRGDMRWAESRGHYWLQLVARLAPDVGPQTAQAEATTLHRQGRAEQIEAANYDPAAEVLATSLILARGPKAPEESVVAKWLAGIALLVLLIACANVANLLLSRAVRQRREVGIRLALGSSRGRVLGQVLTESLILALLGGISALLLTRWGGELVRGLLLPDVHWLGTGLQLRVAGLVAALALLAGVFAGLIPALQTSRPDVAATLKSSSRSASGAASRTRNVLTVTQAALSVVLLISAGLFVRSLERVRSLDLGFDPNGVLLFNPILDQGTTDEERAAFMRRASERLDALPGVEAASPDISIPFYSVSTYSLRVPGLDSVPVLSTGGAAMHAVEPDYFAVMDLEALRGRLITDSDVMGAPPVLVVNETLARTFWPGQEAIGKCIMVGVREGEPDPACSEVVGVVENSRRFGLAEDETMNYYLPIAQADQQEPPNAILMRVRGEEAAMIPVVQRALLEVDPRLRYAEIVSLQERIDPEARAWTLGAALFSVFGVLALVVAAIGLYSILAFSVAQRTFELGIRSALGATRDRLMGLVFAQALRLTAVGIAFGVGLALLVAPKIEPLLFQVSGRDPLILGGVVGVLLLVAILAGILPAWRATRVSPSEALRTE